MIAALGVGLLVLVVLMVAARSGLGSAPEGSGPLPAGAGPALLPGGHNDYDDVIRAALRAAGFSGPDVERYAVLVKAIIQQESGWIVQATGDYDPARCPTNYRTWTNTAGWCALGLGQIHRGYNPDLAIAYDLLDAAGNIGAMAVYLARARAAVGDDVQRVAAAYNGGHSMGLAWPNVPASITRYVASVAGMYERWAGEAGIA